MRRGAFSLVLLALAGLSSQAACSVINDIDVCERAPASELQVNARVEGDQWVGHDSLAAMPGGGAFAAFASEVSADPSDEGRTEVRGTLLDVGAAPQPTFEAENEYTYAPTTSAPGSLQRRSRPSVSAPDVEDGFGVIVYTTSDEESSQIEAVVIRGSGAPSALTLPEATFTVSAEEGPTCAVDGTTILRPARCALSPVAVPLEPTDRVDLHRDYAFFWQAVSVPELGFHTSVVRGSLVRARYQAVEPQPARDQLSPGPVDILSATFVHDLVAIGVGEGRVMLIWATQEVRNTVVVNAMVLDSRLNVVVPTTEIGRSEEESRTPVSLAVAFDGQRVLVVWTEGNGGALAHVVGRLVSPMAVPLGPKRTLSQGEGSQRDPAATTLSARDGFAVAWEAEGDSRDEDGSGTGIRMMLLGADGVPIFANAACGAGDFQVNAEHEGNQRQPALTTLNDGTVVVMWSGPDISGDGLHAVAMDPHTLLPIEE